MSARCWSSCSATPCSPASCGWRRASSITSIADFLGARYGKSFAVASIATLIAVIGAVPYIALQLKAISGSVSLMVEHYTGAPLSFDPFVSDISLVVALLLALFAVLFGTRHADATRASGRAGAGRRGRVHRQAGGLPHRRPGRNLHLLRRTGRHGGAKLAATPAVDQAMIYKTSLGTWLVLTGLSAFAIIMLPRQFYVMIVENRNESELRTASWLFPLYLVAINIFVLPIAFAGLALVGPSTSSDLYVLSVPLLGGHDVLAMIAFIGGLSAATAMVIVASVALSIMISNDLVIPLFVQAPADEQAGGGRRLVGADPECPPHLHLRHSVRRLPLLPPEHRQCAAGLDRIAVLRGDRPVCAFVLRRPDVARRKRARCGAWHDSRPDNLVLHAAFSVAGLA